MERIGRVLKELVDRHAKSSPREIARNATKDHRPVRMLDFQRHGRMNQAQGPPAFSSGPHGDELSFEGLAEGAFGVDLLVVLGERLLHLLKTLLQRLELLGELLELLTKRLFSRP